MSGPRRVFGLDGFDARGATSLLTTLWPLARWPTHKPEHQLGVPIHVRRRLDHLIVPGPPSLNDFQPS